MMSFGLILLSVMSLIAKDYEPNWESLDVKWKGSEFEWQEIPAFKLFKDDRNK
ncbi:MAG: hypothetical protein HOC41_02910 [Candidatus Marinimicrobia bacterium]|nr:hypothetical protein [Candidatus Neomarinimicrobiota bacterium]